MTAVRDPYARGGWYFYGWNRSAQEWVDVQRQSLDPVAWSRPPSGIGSAIADFSRQLQADMNAQPQPLWQQSTAQRVGLQVSPLMDKFADRNPVTGEPLTQGPAMRALDADAKPATLEAWSSLKQAEQRQGRQQLDQVAGDMLAFAMPRYDNGTVNGQLINPLTNQRLSASAQQAAMMNWVGLATLRLGGGGAMPEVVANVAQSAAARASSNFEIHALNELSPSLNISTPLDRAIVWSNSRGGNLALADEFIAGNPGYFRLENTPGGQYLQSRNLFERYNYEQAIQSWERLSARYATGASGEVMAFTSGATPFSVFNRIELPILLRNPNVTNIRYMPPPLPARPRP